MAHFTFRLFVFSVHTDTNEFYLPVAAFVFVFCKDGNKNLPNMSNLRLWLKAKAAWEGEFLVFPKTLLEVKEIAGTRHAIGQRKEGWRN